jgi:hypothetical protein
MQAWKRVLVLFTLQHVVEGGIVYNLTFVIMQSLLQQGGLTKKEVIERFIYFGADGASFFKDATLE